MSRAPRLSPGELARRLAAVKDRQASDDRQDIAMDRLIRALESERPEDQVILLSVYLVTLAIEISGDHQMGARLIVSAVQQHIDGIAAQFLERQPPAGEALN